MANSPKGKFVGLCPGHPCIGMTCRVCEVELVAGDSPCVDEGPDSYFVENDVACGLSLRNPPSTIAHEACVYPPE